MILENTAAEQKEKLLVELAETMRSRYFGKYRGIVKKVDEKTGYITAQVPEVYGDLDSPPAVPAVPFAGQKHGLVLLPEKGDGVWIEFEAGDPSRPLWTGFWWGKGEMPVKNASTTRALVTAKGHQVILDDKQDKLQLLHAGGAEITMTAKDITLKIGSTKIVLSASGVNINNGAFEVK
jgi:hypothetical protein